MSGPVCSNNEVFIIEFGDGFPQIPRVTLAGHRNMVSRVSWYSEGVASTTVPKLVSCSWDQSIRLWDVDAGSSSQAAASGCGEARCIMVGSALHDLSVAPQGVLIAASDNKARIYDLRAKGACYFHFFGSIEMVLTATAVLALSIIPWRLAFTTFFFFKILPYLIKIIIGDFITFIF